MRTRRLPFYECRQGIFEIDEFDCGSIFVVVGDERALVLDTGTGIGDLRWVIENRITDKPMMWLSLTPRRPYRRCGFFDTVWVHARYGLGQWKGCTKLDFRKRYASLSQEGRKTLHL